MPFCSVNFPTSQALQDHMNEDHGCDPATEERQCPLCEFTCDNMESLLNTARVSTILTVVTSVSYIFLQSTSWQTTDGRSMKSVPWVPLWKQVTRATRHQNHCNPEPVGATKLLNQPQRCAAKATRHWNCRYGRSSR